VNLAGTEPIAVELERLINAKKTAENQNPLSSSGLKKVVVLPEQISNLFSQDLFQFTVEKST
jgi:hypothetical protein